MTQAPVEQSIIKQCMTEGRELPPRIANAPQLQLGLEVYYEAFWDLSTCRETGFSLGPIPWWAILDYAVRFDMDDEQLEALNFYIRALDEEWREFYRKKGEKGSTPIGKRKGSKWQPVVRSRNSRGG